MFILGPRSRAAMVGLHPDMQKVIELAITLSEIDFMVLEGLRSDEQCYINWGQGRTAADCKRVGIAQKYAQPKLPKVTWLKNPLSSNHRKSKDGKGHAVDVYPYPLSLVFGNKKPKDYEPLFDKIALAMFKAASQLNIAIRWGSDWDMDKMPRERGETDNPHFELR